MAKILKDAVRPTDILGRIGGDEFIICFPNTTEEEALAIKHQIRKRQQGQSSEALLYP